MGTTTYLILLPSTALCTAALPLHFLQLLLPLHILFYFSLLPSALLLSNCTFYNFFYHYISYSTSLYCPLHFCSTTAFSTTSSTTTYPILLPSTALCTAALPLL